MWPRYSRISLSITASRLVLFDANLVGRCHVAEKWIRHDLSH